MIKKINEFLIIIAKFFEPEKAHFFALILLKYNFFSKFFSKKKFEFLNTSFFNVKINNPIGVAAGFDKNGEAIRGIFNLGVGIVEIGAVTPKPQYGNERPRIFRLNEDNALINRLGFNNQGMIKIKKNIKKYNHGVLGINVGANKDSNDKVSDFIEVISYFSKEVDYFTINISSPNTHMLRSLQKKENLDELLKRINSNNKEKKINKPILIKISPDLDDEELKIIVELCQIHKIAGIVATNTTVNRDFNFISKNSQKSGGLSGKPLFQKSNIILAKLYFLSKGTIPLVGVGGIFNGQDAYKKICLGATTVQLYTALTYNGPILLNKILDEMNTLVKKDGFSNISEAVGSKNFQFLMDETDRSIFG